MYQPTTEPTRIRFAGVRVYNAHMRGMEGRVLLPHDIEDLSGVIATALDDTGDYDETPWVDLEDAACEALDSHGFYVGVPRPDRVPSLGDLMRRARAALAE